MVGNVTGNCDDFCNCFDIIAFPLELNVIPEFVKFVVGATTDVPFNAYWL